MERRFRLLLQTHEEEAVTVRLAPLKLALLIAFAVLQIADVVTTQRVLAQGGWEANPLQLWSMSHFGDYWPVPKLILMAICMSFMFRWKPKHVAPFVVLMAVVVANNTLWAFG